MTICCSSPTSSGGGGLGPYDGRDDLLLVDLEPDPARGSGPDHDRDHTLFSR
jgi:hypothetical protein